LDWHLEVKFEAVWVCSLICSYVSSYRKTTLTGSANEA
jgi:hypothetical protein